MNRPTALTLIVVALLLAIVVVVSSSGERNWLGYDKGYMPQQPIAYSHRLHAGQLGIDCQYCHDTADNGLHAGIPPASTCMNCHEHVTTVTGSTEPSPEIAKLRAAVASGEPIRWVRVHDLPDFVRFDHSRHVNSGVDCQACHGAVETMEEVRQANDLSMGWCVNCHRQWQTAPPATYSPMPGTTGPSTDCSGCHH